MHQHFLDKRRLGSLLVAGAIAAACSATHAGDEPTASPDASPGAGGVGGARTAGNAAQSDGGRTAADASDEGARGAEAGAGGARIAVGGDDAEGGGDVLADAGLGVADARDIDAEPDAVEPGAAGAPSGTSPGGSGGTGGSAGTSGTGSAPTDAGLPPIDCSAPLPEPPSDAGSATRHDVQTILDARCVYCHSTATAPMDLVLTDIAAVVSTHSQECATKLRIQPGDAQESYLIDKISGHSQSPCGCFMGQQMPLDDDPLDAQDIAVIRSWIDAGAY